MLTQRYYEARGFSLLSFLLAFSLTILLGVLVVRSLLWGQRLWVEQSHDLLSLQRVGSLSLMLSDWWQVQHLACESRCGCHWQVSKFSQQVVLDDRVDADSNGGYGIMVPRCYEGELVWSYLFIGVYRGLSGVGLGLYRQLGSHPKQLLMWGVQHLEVVRVADSLGHWQKLAEGHSLDNPIGLVIDSTLIPGHWLHWRVVVQAV